MSEVFQILKSEDMVCLSVLYFLFVFAGWAWCYWEGEHEWFTELYVYATLAFLASVLVSGLD